MIQSFAKFGAIDASVSLLLQHAVSSKDSKWRKNKKWQELLYYTGEIGSFVKVAGKEETGYSEETTAARAGKYILVRTDWGAWGGGDADGGSFLYLLDDKDAEYAKHNSKLAAS